MTTSDDTTALRYVREEFNTLRTAVREDFTGVRTSIDSLAHDLRVFTSEQIPRIAVLERRADDTAADITDLRAATSHVAELDRLVAGHTRELTALTQQQAEGYRTRNQIIAGLIVGVILAFVAAVLAWLPQLLATP